MHLFKLLKREDKGEEEKLKMIDFLTLSDPFLWHYVRKYVPPSIKIGNFLLEKTLPRITLRASFLEYDQSKGHEIKGGELWHSC